MMFACEYVWDPVRAAEVRAIVERATGGPCPCATGRSCPFVRVPEEEQEESRAS